MVVGGRVADRMVKRKNHLVDFLFKYGVLVYIIMVVFIPKTVLLIKTL